MIQKFIEHGYQIIEENDEIQTPDICVINTCTVTNMSDRKSRQMLRRVKEKNKNTIVVAVGCYVQVSKDTLNEIEEIDVVLGNNEKVEIVTHVENYIKDNVEQIEIEDVMKSKEFTEYGDITFSEKTRAVVKIQDGCDRFCSYCIIPYARGRVRSRKSKNIISEITKIAKQGIKEIVITGIHIASYGKDFKEEYKLINLLEDINEIEGIERIRLGSIEPLIITEEFVERLSKLEKICHHFHLSLQSGCDDTLERMNRRYTVEEFRKITKILRNKYEDVILTTDIIVGFPGETEEEFEKTYEFLKEIKFYKMHIFKYSPRKGTKAASMPNQIEGKIKEQRSKRLLELSDKNQLEYNKKYIGKEIEILFEEEKKGIYKGHTSNYIEGHLNFDEKAIQNKISRIQNNLVKVKCKDANENNIIVEL